MLNMITRHEKKIKNDKKHDPKNNINTTQIHKYVKIVQRKKYVSKFI